MGVACGKKKEIIMVPLLWSQLVARFGADCSRILAKLLHLFITMAEEFQRTKLYQYAANSNLVLEAERDGRRNKDEGTG